ncbi:MAG: hypothetical protein WAZ12_00565 [Candidatus Absconditicoccaceae bacterium]
MGNENKNENQENEGSLNLDSLQSSSDFNDNEIDQSIAGLKKQEAGPGTYLNLDIIDQDIKETRQDDSRIILGDDGMKTDLTNVIVSRSYWKLFILSFFGMIIFSLISAGLFIYNSYLQDLKTSVTESQYDKYIKQYDSLKKETFGLIFNKPISDVVQLDLASEKGVQTLESFLKNSSFTYIKKRDVLQVSLDNLVNSTTSIYTEVTDKKNYVTKYGFFTQELKDLLKDQDNMSNIKRSLLSLENIKFSSAIQVFSYLDTFIDGLAKSLNVEKDQINTGMKDVIDRSEKDIMVYLNNCYLNPFEIDYDCNTIGDFDMYYNIKGQTGFDTSFFKRLIYYIDLKLEQTEIPSFSIMFNGFSSNSNQITFSINVDTFKQDELSLVEKGISNPHIFIVKNLINFLKQSKFILGKDITTKNIKVQPRTITIGSNQFNVNHSAMNFSLPIQKDSEREIFDFVEIIK